MESERIKHDIDRTRERMSGTIDEIQERLTPSRLLHDATVSVREATVDSAKRVLRQAGRTAGRTAGHARAASVRAARYAKSHPTPLALVLSGLALVLARTLANRRGRHTRDTSQDWGEAASASSSWIAENALAVGAAVAAAGTVAGVRWANRRSPFQSTDLVRR